MKKILVFVDFSLSTDMVCQYAIEFARNTATEILLFHNCIDQVVIPDNTFLTSMDMNTMYNEELMKELWHQSEKNLTDLKEKVKLKIDRAQLNNIQIQTALTGGDIELELKDICLSYKPDLMVMGMKGKGKSVNAFGRIATFIVNNIQIPVLMIPELKGFLGFRETMVAVGLEDENLIMIDQMTDLLSPFEVQIHCVHFLVHKQNPKAETIRFETLKNSFPVNEKSGNVSFEMVEAIDNNQLNIENYIKNNNITLLAYQPHKHSLLYTLFTGNITKKNFFQINIPIIALPLME